jgi:hypothetical protein
MQKIRESRRSSWAEGLSRAGGLNLRAADQNVGAAQHIIAAEEAEQKSSGVTGKNSLTEELSRAEDVTGMGARHKSRRRSVRTEDPREQKSWAGRKVWAEQWECSELSRRVELNGALERKSRAEERNGWAAEQNGGAAQQIIAAEEAEQKRSGVTGKNSWAEEPSRAQEYNRYGGWTKVPQKTRQSRRSERAEGLRWAEGLSRAGGLNLRAADQNGGAAQHIIAAEEAE